MIGLDTALGAPVGGCLLLQDELRSKHHNANQSTNCQRVKSTFFGQFFQDVIVLPLFHFGGNHSVGHDSSIVVRLFERFVTKEIGRRRFVTKKTELKRELFFQQSFLKNILGSCCGGGTVDAAQDDLLDSLLVQSCQWAKRDGDDDNNNIDRGVLERHRNVKDTTRRQWTSLSWNPCRGVAPGRHTFTELLQFCNRTLSKVLGAFLRLLTEECTTVSGIGGNTDAFIRKRTIYSGHFSVSTSNNCEEAQP